LAPELSTLSGDFRSKWGAHDVRRHAAGRKRFHHPVVGDLDLLFESTDVAADPGWKLLIYTAEPGSPTADAIQLLASWAATQEHHSTPIRPQPSSRTSLDLVLRLTRRYAGVPITHCNFGHTLPRAVVPVASA